MIVRVLSGCCPSAYMGKSQSAKGDTPRGRYYGCMQCGQLVDRQDAAYQIRLMRRTCKEFGIRAVKKQ